MPYRTAVLLFLSWFAAGTSWGQFRTQFVDGRVQVHGFFTQGYAVSNQNNYLTMNTSQGTAKMTDGGLNMSWQINNKLRVGAQVYARSIGRWWIIAFATGWGSAQER